MEDIPNDMMLWRGKWNSQQYPSMIANGILVVLLKKPYNSAKKYSTRAFIIYQGVYRKGGRISIPIDVEVKIPDLVGSDELKQHVEYEFKGQYNNQDINYKVTKFEDKQIKGTYSLTRGEYEDRGEFFIDETQERRIDTYQAAGCIIS